MLTLAWNLAHQVKVRPIPDDLVDVILDLGAETVLVNEYVDDLSREPFKEAMREAGYAYLAVLEMGPQSFNSPISLDRSV